MSVEPSLDPMAMMRSALDQWEKLANEYGAQFLQRPETTKAMQTMTAGYLQMQKALQDAMGKALAVANLPSRTDIEALSARLGAIEASLARIEAGKPSEPTVAALPRPPRTRQPPAKS
ncbi:hypothetical protein [Novosphingobium sp. Gsoil 351]|uniref:hypothetical protein n=1 Tax=Novosphingobium sp. Gsoil 351 TaxID=2675225 RepID=UPI0012B4E080|nr:hypothetical protein [Novosphingobium sp. Gsoil 351]QGN54606.1 hypothetical protein GKE62_08600 [Novosphingobium sp. Gsoil 351]